MLRAVAQDQRLTRAGDAVNHSMAFAEAASELLLLQIHHAHQVINALERDTQLVQGEGPHQGKVCFPWSYGVVFSRITRKQFEDSGLGEAVEPNRVICQDEMTENADAEAFQRQLWGMFPTAMRGALTLPQIDRIRWLLFPELRISPQLGLFGSESVEGDLPDLMRVMDLQQEQLARSLGEGHRVIHGVAGSGKTLILGYRAEQLAQSATNKPITSPDEECRPKINVSASFHSWGFERGSPRRPRS